MTNTKKILIFRKPFQSVDKDYIDNAVAGVNETVNELDGKSVKHIEVTDIKGLTNEQCEGLKPGDMVIKVTDTHKHSYRVSYKGETGMCLTYSDCENVETVAYDKTGDDWAWTSTDITPISNS